MEFTKERTNIAKGIAICLMFAHHLYSFNERLLNDNYYLPLIPLFNAEAIIGDLGQICVSMFLFLSGYGMLLGYCRSQKNSFEYSIKKLIDFYLTYWLYFLIFVAIGIIFFHHVTLWQSNQVRYLLEPKIFLENFLGLNSRYNEEYWFVRPFVIILLCLNPLYSILINKNKGTALVFCVSLILLLFNRYPYNQFNFFYWQAPFALGMICAKLNFFSSHMIKDLDKAGWIWVFACLLLLFILRIRVGEIWYAYSIVPLFIYFSIRASEILNLSILLAYLGQYSFPLWLTHTFFCYYYFQDIIYFPRWSPIIFILLLTTSLLSVLLIEFLRSWFMQLAGLRIP